MDYGLKFSLILVLLIPFISRGDEQEEARQERAYNVCMNHVPEQADASCRALSLRGDFDRDALSFCDRNSRDSQVFGSPSTNIYTCLNFVMNKEFRKDSLQSCEESTDASASRRACLHAYHSNRRFNENVTNYCTQNVRFLQEHLCLRDLSAFRVKARESNFCQLNSVVMSDRSHQHHSSEDQLHYVREEKNCIHYFTAHNVPRRDLNNCSRESYVTGISQYTTPLNCLRALDEAADSSLANSGVIDQHGVICGSGTSTCDLWALERFPWEQQAPNRAPASIDPR